MKFIRSKKTALSVHISPDNQPAVISISLILLLHTFVE